MIQAEFLEAANIAGNGALYTYGATKATVVMSAMTAWLSEIPLLSSEVTATVVSAPTPSAELASAALARRW